MVLDFLPFGSEIFAGIIILITVVLAKIVNYTVSKIAKHVTSKTSTTLDDIIVKAVQRPIFIGILLGGIFIAIPYIGPLFVFAAEITLGFGVLYTLFGLWFAIRIVNAGIEWYSTEMAHKTKTDKDDQFLPIIKKVVMGVFGVIALIMILGIFGIEITALIAAMGLGGLAIALALQPTLTNFFSGTQLVVDQPVRIGDFIELDSGEKGTITDIGWRSTKLKIFGDNVLIIPNSLMAEAKIINYNYPAKPFMFTLDCGVGYNEDLEKVEKVTIETAKASMKNLGTGLEEFEPFIRYKEFGDSNINFSIYFHVKKYGDKFLLRHEFIKDLKKRFDKEGIEISWPIRKVYYGDSEVLRSFKKK